MVSELPKTMSFPVTVKSPLKAVVVAVTATVPSAELDMVSELPKTMSLPVTVKSPLKDVVVAVTKTVPSLEFVMVSSFSKITPAEPVTSKEALAVMVVNAPVEAEFAPIAEPSIAPPSISTASKFAVPSIYKSLNSTELLPRSTSPSSDADQRVISPLPIVTVLSPFPEVP